jgi:hypothetical protein
MKHLATRPIAPLLLLAALLAEGCASAPIEPCYQGVPLRQWAESLGDRDEDTHKRAINALHVFGGEAVPSVLAALKKDDWLTRRNAVTALYRISHAAGRPGVEALVAALKDTDARVRIRAAYVLEIMIDAVAEWSEEEPGERPSIPEGPPPYDKAPKVYLPGWEQLSGALPALADALNDREAEVRRLSVEALGSSRSAGAPWVRALAEKLSDKDESMRLAAGLALAKIGTEEAKAVVPFPLLLETIEQKKVDWSKRLDMIHVIGKLGAPAKPAVPLFIKLLSYQGESNSPRYAAYALGRIGPEAREAIPALEEMARSNNADFKKAASWALERIRKNP